MIKKFFRGDFDLITSFWGFYFLANSTFTYILVSLWKYDTFAILFSLFVAMPYKIFSIVGTWRSAAKYKLEKKKNKKGTAWGTAAQVYICFSIFRTIIEIIKHS